jgi:hypothetical protein
VFGGLSLELRLQPLLGILFALFFGQGQPDSSNLNWVNYHGGTGEDDPAAWARQRYLALLFCLRRSALSLYTLLIAY